MPLVAVFRVRKDDQTGEYVMKLDEDNNYIYLNEDELMSLLCNIKSLKIVSYEITDSGYLQKMSIFKIGSYSDIDEIAIQYQNYYADNIDIKAGYKNGLWRIKLVDNKRDMAAIVESNIGNNWCNFAAVDINADWESML